MLLLLHRDAINPPNLHTQSDFYLLIFTQTLLIKHQLVLWNQQFPQIHFSNLPGKFINKRFNILSRFCVVSYCEWYFFRVKFFAVGCLRFLSCTRITGFNLIIERGWFFLFISSLFFLLPIHFVFIFNRKKVESLLGRIINNGLTVLDNVMVLLNKNFRTMDNDSFQNRLN